MNRRHFLSIAGFGAAAAAVVGLTRSSGNRYYTGPVSDHFDGKRFFNPDGVPPGGFRDLLRWQFDREHRATWPESLDSPWRGAVPQTREDDLVVTMIGHATLLIQFEGINILTDPVFSDRASPFQWAGPKRVTPPGIAFDDLPPIDLVLLSHNHYDHLDLLTLEKLQAVHNPLVLTPLGNDTILKDAIPDIRVSAMDWGDAQTFGALRLHLDPCHHWSARGSRDRRMALWGTFTVTGASGSVVFIGDTGFDKGRPFEALRRHLPIRLLIQPIGAYEPRWFMKGQHQNPAEAVQGFLKSGAQAAIGHHWATFQLTDEALDAPRDALTKALNTEGLEAARFRALRAGERWVPVAAA